MGWLELIGTLSFDILVFCIDSIVSGFVVYYVNFRGTNKHFEGIL